jgi:choline dehydrogenase
MADVRPAGSAAKAAAEADYVVVGGGAAGCVVASRLSENAARRVILLEAGGRDTSPYIHLPVAYYKTTGPGFTWGYETAPSASQGGIKTPYAQARVLGGGSSINAQVYIRGTPQDFNEWRDDFGCAGWGYSDVLPYFMKAEDNQRFADSVHGAGGPLKVSDQAHTHPLTFAWLKACQQAGIPFNADFNAGEQAGCGLYQVTNRDGRRSSAARCYLGPAERRANLVVMTRTQASRIVFDGSRAVGVEATGEGGERIFVRAAREVIVTSGAIGTPHLLMLSGVGSAAHLKESGVEVVADLPAVGRNLQDHLDVFLIYQLTGPHSYDKYKKLHWQAWAGFQYALFRSGPITSNVVEGGAFWWVDRNDSLPDVQLHFLAGAGVEAGIADVPGGHGCTLNAYLVRPKSRGAVTLRSPDPKTHPSIDPNYLSAAEDLKLTVDAVRLGRRIMAQEALNGYLMKEHFPGPSFESQDELEQFVRQQARTGYHPSGTCRMGASEEAVVDTQLRVHGVDGLRIADASVMPRLVSGNTNATTIMIGERAADFIRGNA